MADQCLELIREFAPDTDFKYNKFYIGLTSQGRTNNFASAKPQKKRLVLALRLARSEDLEQEFEQAVPF